jgi:putative ABC exporter
MIAASAYIIACSARNRLRVRLRRLREPRYLVGAVVGLAYIYFSLFGGFRRRASARRRRTLETARMPGAMAPLMAGLPTLGGLVLMALAALGWAAPFDSGLLTFSQAETEFLFPAPVPRRSLLVYRMLRSQIGMLFGAGVIAITAPAGDRFVRLRVAIAMWLLMCTWKVYYAGITLTRSRLAAAGLPRRVAAVPLAALAAALAVVGTLVWRSAQAAPIAGVADLLQRLAAVEDSRLASIVLWPFVAVIRPFVAESAPAYMAAIAGSLVVLAAAGAWVVLIDSAFQDAAEQVWTRREAAKQASAARYRSQAVAWQLPATGRPEAVFAWKAAVQTLRAIDRGSALRILVGVSAFAAATLLLGQRGGADALAVLVLAAAGFSIMLAPQALRIDLRQDLQQIDLLKTWPVPAAAVIRGELIWPGILLTAAAWTLVAMAWLLPGGPLARVDDALRFSAGASAVLAAPALIFGQLAIHNGMAIAFPAWMPLGGQRARGLDVMGQRIILLGGTWLLLIVMLIPAVVPAAVVWFVLRSFIHAAAWVPAAVIVSGVMFVEVFVATELLAPLYERLDLSAIDRAEQ